MVPNSNLDEKIFFEIFFRNFFLFWKFFVDLKRQQIGRLTVFSKILKNTKIAEKNLKTLHFRSAPFSKGLKNRKNFQKNLQKKFFSKKIIFWKIFFWIER